MNLVLIERREIDNEGWCTISGRRALHIHQAMEPKPGKILRSGLVNGPLGDLEIRESKPDVLTATWHERSPCPDLPDISLLLALPRPKVLKRLFRPLAELGVKHILLTNAAEVERNYFDTHVVEESYYHDQLLQGLEQAGHTRLPQVSIHRQLKPLVEDELDRLYPDVERALAHPGPATLQSITTPALLALGPEPGWNDFERELLMKHRFKLFSLGPVTLKVDTACLALVSLLRFG